MSRHVQWDEQGLAQADQDLHAIQKRANRPPPEPKTPFIPLNNTMSASDDDFSLDPTASADTEGDTGDTVGRRESTDASEEEDFMMHRKHHYMHDGEALAKGRALLEGE
jgi:hypothetical protein